MAWGNIAAVDCRDEGSRGEGCKVWAGIAAAVNRGVGNKDAANRGAGSIAAGSIVAVVYKDAGNMGAGNRGVERKE